MEGRVPYSTRSAAKIPNPERLLLRYMASLPCVGEFVVRLGAIEGGFGFHVSTSVFQNTGIHRPDASPFRYLR